MKPLLPLRDSSKTYSSKTYSSKTYSSKTYSSKTYSSSSKTIASSIKSGNWGKAVAIRA